MTEVTAYPDSSAAEEWLGAVAPAVAATAAPLASRPFRAQDDAAAVSAPACLERLLLTSPLGRVPMPAATVATTAATVHDAARLLAAAPSRCLVVMDQHQPVGIVTLSDLLRPIAIRSQKLRPAPRRKAAQCESITTIMTPHPRLAARDDALADAIQFMAQAAIAHLPVLDSAGQIHGILTPQAVTAAIVQMLDAL